MKKLFLILSIGILLVFAITAVWAYLAQDLTEPEPTPPITFPTAGTSNNRSFEEPRSFLDFSDTKEDPENPGYYYLGYQTFGDSAVEDPPYLVTYIEETRYFNITLRTEPIGEVRRDMEAFLRQRLGLTEDEMCRLNYMVAVPAFVNSAYSGVNLGFSFCESAVRLP